MNKTVNSMHLHGCAFFTWLFKKFKIVSENVKLNEKDYKTSGSFRTTKESKVSMMIG